jgi:hypothetical protein
MWRTGRRFAAYPTVSQPRAAPIAVDRGMAPGASWRRCHTLGRLGWWSSCRRSPERQPSSSAPRGRSTWSAAARRRRRDGHLPLLDQRGQRDRPSLGGFVFPWSPSSAFVIDAVTSLCCAAVACLELPRRRPECPEEVTVTDVSGHRPSVLRDAFASLRLRNSSPVSWRSRTSLPCPLQLAERGWEPAAYTFVVALDARNRREDPHLPQSTPLPRQGALSPFECAQQLDAEAGPTAALRRSCHALAYPYAFRGFLARGGC